MKGSYMINNLWRKYAVTVKTIETERRDAASKQLQVVLLELGYE